MPSAAKTRKPKPPAAPTPPVDLLRRLTGNKKANFRDGQLEAIEQIVERRGRVLCVQRTGWGKSAVYFVATAMLRERGRRPDDPRLPADRPDAQPARRRLGARHRSRHRQLLQSRRLGRDLRPDRGRRDRPAPAQPRATGQPAVPAQHPLPSSSGPPACSSSTRPTASPTGATTSAPTTAASPASSSACRRQRQFCAPQPLPTTA